MEQNATFFFTQKEDSFNLIMQSLINYTPGTIENKALNDG